MRTHLAPILSRPLTRLRAGFANLAFDRVIRPRYPVWLATEPAEREAVYRFRYRVYVGEQNNRHHPELDARKQWIHGPVDDDPATRIYVLGTPEKVLGTVRIRTWAPGTVQAEVARFHSLDRLPGVERLSVGDIKMAMVDPSLRGTHAAGAMLVNALLDAMRDRPVDLWFAISAPGLLRRYHQLGFDPHGGRLQSTHRGLEVSIVGLAGDLAEMRRRGSPIVRALSRAGVPQGGALVDRYRALIAEETTVCGRFAEVHAAVQQAAQAPGHLLHGLSAEALALVARGGLILNLDDGDRLVRQDFIEKEIFCVLDGRLRLVRDGQPVGTCATGHTLGETALRPGERRRASDAFAEGPTRVLALPPTLLRRLDRLPDDRARLSARVESAGNQWAQAMEQ